jgi:hypothetical protein
MDPWRSPQRIGDAHLADQPAYFQWYPWSATTRSRLPAPVQSETGTMPANYGLRLDDRQRIANSRDHPIETNEYHSVDSAEGEFPWNTSLQDVYLLP